MEDEIKDGSNLQYLHDCFENLIYYVGCCNIVVITETPKEAFAYISESEMFKKGVRDKDENNLFFSYRGKQDVYFCKPDDIKLGLILLAHYITERKTWECLTVKQKETLKTKCKRLSDYNSAEL